MNIAGSMACSDAGEIATNLWYSQAQNYSYSDPRLNADTDTFTQVRTTNLKLSLSHTMFSLLQAFLSSPSQVFKNEINSTLPASDSFAKCG